MTPTPLSPDVARIAIVCPSWVGDTVMCTPVLRALRQRCPEARITAIVRRGLDELLHGLPFIDATIVCEMKGLFGPQRLAKAVRQTDAQAALLLPNSFRAAVAARLAGAPVRIGYDRDGRGALLTHKLPPGRSRQPVAMIDYYAQLACFALGVERIDQHLELATTPDEQAAADVLLQGLQPPIIALNPGANRPDKRWPAERFAAAADGLAEDLKASIVITGSPAETEILAAIEKAARTPLLNLTRRSPGVTLGSLKAVLVRAGLLITNDTGPRHIAAALGTPTVTLFGPTDHRWTTLVGVGGRERILVAEPFLPEQLVADEHPKGCAIEKIEVNDVIAAAKEILKPLAA